VLIEHFGLGRIPSLPPRYNIAPSQEVAVVRHSLEAPFRRLDMLRWGLIPSWSKDPSTAYRMINARGESVAEKPAFRRAFRQRRCLVAADGFYEWKKTERQKQPYFIHLQDHSPLAFAGLWESWQPPAAHEDPIETCTIITTDANELMRELHDRMPAILAPDQYALWLDPDVQDPKRVQPLLAPYPADAMVAAPVSTYVNSPAHDDAKCVEIQPLG
jgi:putative SOS response-associated peptidase YedK